MRVEALKQCDAGAGADRKALFPGQRYDLPDDIAEGLKVAGLVREIRETKPAEAEPRNAERPRGRKR